MCVRLILLFLLSHVLLIEAKQLNLKEGVDVYSVYILLLSMVPKCVPKPSPLTLPVIL